jgi:hypothetical protein
MTSSRSCLTILTSLTFTILSLQTLLSRVMLYTSCNDGTQDVCVLVPRGARDGRAQLLDRPHDEIRSRVDSMQRAQSAWQDGQPIFPAVHNPARLRYGKVSVKEGDSAGADERGSGVRARPAKQRDCLSRITAADSRYW